MRIPRLRLKLRTLMVLIALVALAMPVVHRLIWLYQSPPSVPLDLEVTTTAVRSTERARLPYTPYPVGQSVESRFSYACELLPQVPTALPYHVSVVTSLLDPASAVVESHRTSHLLIAGASGWDRIRGEFVCGLTPRRSGLHAVQHEFVVTDVFGRIRRAVIPSSQFGAK